MVCNKQMKRLIFSILIFVGGFALNVDAKETCSTVVNISTEQKMLSDALVYLAKENGFTLSFPKSLDRKLAVNESMPLDKMVQYLTRDLNTLLKHGESASCSGKKLTELIVVPAGDDADLISVSASFKQQKTKEYLYIEDMDAYARDVKDGKYKANTHMMTPEQRVAFKHSKRKLQKNHSRSE